MRVDINSAFLYHRFDTMVSILNIIEPIFLKQKRLFHVNLFT